MRLNCWYMTSCFLSSLISWNTNFLLCCNRHCRALSSPFGFTTSGLISNDQYLHFFAWGRSLRWSSLSNRELVSLPLLQWPLWTNEGPESVYRNPSSPTPWVGCMYMLDTSVTESEVLGPAAPASPGGSSGMLMLSPTSHLLTQDAWGWGPGVCVLTGSPGDPVQDSLRLAAGHCFPELPLELSSSLPSW